MWSGYMVVWFGDCLFFFVGGGVAIWTLSTGVLQVRLYTGLCCYGAALNF